MTSFDDRKQGFESKFALDEELSFKAIARRNKLIGHWAAEKLGKTDATAEEYARDVVLADFEHSGDGDVVAKLLKDFHNAGLTMTAEEIHKQLEHFLAIAREQLLGATNQ